MSLIKFFHGTDGKESMKRLSFFVFIFLYAFYFFANLFDNKLVLNADLQESLLSLTKLLIGAIFLERGMDILDKKVNQPTAISTTASTSDGSTTAVTQTTGQQ